LFSKSNCSVVLSLCELQARSHRRSTEPLTNRHHFTSDVVVVRAFRWKQRVRILPGRPLLLPLLDHLRRYLLGPFSRQIQRSVRTSCVSSESLVRRDLVERSIVIDDVVRTTPLVSVYDAILALDVPIKSRI